MPNEDKDVFEILIDDYIAKNKQKSLQNQHVARLHKTLENSKSDIIKSYEGLRDFVKQMYMKTPKGLLDRHKIAASFTIACMNELLITDKKGDLPKNEVVYNLTVVEASINMGITVLTTMICKGNTNYKDAGLIAHLKKNNNMFYPLEVICDENEFKENWKMELYHAYADKKLFILSLSHEFFSLEAYNRKLAEIESLTPKMQKTP
jgi:hypothetical protein